MYNTLNALSLGDSRWFEPGNANPPGAEADFAVAPCGDGKVVIIGGGTAAQTTFVQMSQVRVFDMESQSWTLVSASTTAGQSQPEERVGHTAVTRSDGIVVVVGGTVGLTNTAAMPLITVLDTSSSPFVWSSPIVTGNASLAPANGITGHAAIMTRGDVLILAFGKDTLGGFNQQVYFLDTQKMAWLEGYTPTISRSASQSTNTPSSADTPQDTASSVSSSTSASAAASTSSDKTKVAVSTAIPITLLALTSAVAIIFIFRRRRLNSTAPRESVQHLLHHSYPPYYPPTPPNKSRPAHRVFKRIFSRGKAHMSPPPAQPLGMFLPDWAQKAQGGSAKSWSAGDDESVTEGKMVQMASMSFMAPKMQLRVVNPDEESIFEESMRRRISAGKQV
jgi:hypothetical protein